jgi:hypothetical protein
MPFSRSIAGLSVSGGFYHGQAGIAGEEGICLTGQIMAA